MASTEEADRYGKSQHDPGAKLDAGKNRLGLVLMGLAAALEEVGKVGTYGADKYTPNGWEFVPNGIERYTDAMFRHLLAERRENRDADTGLLHAAHAAWNALARLELMTRQGNSETDNTVISKDCLDMGHPRNGSVFNDGPGYQSSVSSLTGKAGAILANI